MNTRLLKVIYRNKIVQIAHITPTPRWITFIVDLCIVAVSALVVFLFPMELTAQSLNLQQIGYCLIIFVYAIANLLTGSYKCIVRYSVTDDLFKSFYLVMLSTILLCSLSLCYSFFSDNHVVLISIPALLIIGVMSLCVMMLLRIFIKYLYHQISNIQSKREPIIVLGSAINSISLANTLKNEIDGHFDPVALLSLNKDQKHSQVNGIKIEKFAEDTIGEIFAKHGVKTLVFLQNHMDMMRDGFAEMFIKNHIKLKMLNQIEEFDMNENNNGMNVSSHVRQIRIEDLLGRPVIENDNPLIKNQIRDNVVMITGAAGSIGSEIVRQVASFGAKEIVLLDQAETPMHNMQLEMAEKFPDTNIKLVVADVQNYDRLEQTFSKYRPVLVYHAAAYKHVPMMERNPSEAILTNVMGSKNLADLSVKYGVKKFVMISTDKAVNPTNIMGASKRLAEIYVQSLFNNLMLSGNEDSTKFITTRFGNVLGSNGSVIPLFREQIEKGGPVTVTHKDIIRYFMTIQEACSLVLEAGCMGNGGEIYIFDMGKPVKIYDLAERMIMLAGLRVNEDIKIIETGLRPGEKLYEELLNDKEKTTATSNKKIMIAKVRKYSFTEVETQIQSLISFAKNGEIHSMVTMMKNIVPEFISNNSEFTKIDKEIEQKNND